MEQSKFEYRAPLQWGDLDPYRRERTHVGMWAWLIQRFSAVLIVIFLTLHLFFTYKPFLQFMLLVAVALHAALGLRVILLDFNLADIKRQRNLVYWLPGIGLALVLLIWGIIY
ncbi:succinate dehydrogenase [Nitratidesulfovibrio sp. SRB-5]|uniref:succinate dehydrogenase n=1 Tax=Nitratidesulfovibrio sp. SRB-5 TaxID=2872636 RepID=UPI001026A506|nr:succinate dehydrogenase [Nitratidesulfovibrio sp. SRB-5]MBZ2172962.1 succinate dehydrogenase [Nitratidesulfovibrio sp. SRB-5]RXF78502.1 succinate dehydrogenase [Desulfovibrio sp. DS-1]